MGVTFQGVGKGGHVCPDIGKNLCGGVPGGPAVLVGDMGDETLHWGGVEQIPPQGIPQADGTATSEGEGREVGVSPASESDGVERITRGGDLSLLSPEHSHTVNCDQAHYGPVSDGGEAYGVTGDQAVEGSGRLGLGGDADGGSGGRLGGGGG